MQCGTSHLQTIQENILSRIILATYRRFTVATVRFTKKFRCNLYTHPRYHQVANITSGTIVRAIKASECIGYIYLYIYIYIYIYLSIYLVVGAIRQNRLYVIVSVQVTTEGNVLLNGVLNTLYLRLYGFIHIVKDHSDTKRGNLLPPLHGLPFPISSKG